MKTKTSIYWVIMHIIAFPLALLLGFVAIHIFSFITKFLPDIVASGMSYILWGGILGTSIGFLQWQFLKKHHIPTGWIWKSALGFIISETLAVITLLCIGIDRNIDLVYSFGPLVWTITYLVGGSISGYLQTAYLKNLIIYKHFWTITNALVWGISTLLWTVLIKLQTMGNYAVLLGGLGIGILSIIAINYIIRGNKLNN